MTTLHIPFREASKVGLFSLRQSKFRASHTVMTELAMGWREKHSTKQETERSCIDSVEGW